MYFFQLINFFRYYVHKKILR